MTKPLSRQSRLWLVYASVIAILVAIAWIMILDRFQHDRQSVHKATDEQLVRLSNKISDALEDGRYDRIQGMFQRWISQYPNTLLLQLTSQNGYVIARHAQPESSGHRLHQQTPVEYGYRGRANLTYVVDTVEVYEHLHFAILTASAGLLVVMLFSAYLININRQREIETAKLSSLSSKLNIRNAQLSDEHALLQSVIDSIPDLIYFKAPNGTYKGANRAFCAFHGVARQALSGKPDSELFADTHSQEREERDLRVIASREEDRTDLHYRDDKGERKVIDSLHAPYYDEQHNMLGMIGIERDITRLREYQNSLETMAYRDPLTGLPNRRYLVDRMQSDRASAERKGTKLAVCAIDLDGFKPINDRYGHATGDKVILAFSARLQTLLREDDTVARWGGDEFTVLLKDIGNATTCIQLLERMMEMLRSPFEIGDITLQLNASIGVTLYPDDNHDADTLLRHADQAMYQSKQNGKNTFTFFDPEQNRSIHAQAENLARLAKGIDNDELRVFYQPQINMRDGSIHGFEALVRWQHPEEGLLSPGRFLPLVENHPLGIQLDWWVLERVLQHISEWNRPQRTLPRVGVNLAAMTLQQSDFVTRLRRLLDQYPDARGRLQLEILETSALADIGQITQTIEQCHEFQVSFAIDDFGTGYSSLTYLRRLPAQTLKIDRSFVGDMLHNEDDLKIVEGILRMGEAFDRDVLAEGVESVAHGIALLQLGCVYAQGYGIARPMPPHEIPAWIGTYRLPAEWIKAAGQRLPRPAI